MKLSQNQQQDVKAESIKTQSEAVSVSFSLEKHHLKALLVFSMEYTSESRWLYP